MKDEMEYLARIAGVMFLLGMAIVLLDDWLTFNPDLKQSILYALVFIVAQDTADWCRGRSD